MNNIPASKIKNQETDRMRNDAALITSREMTAPKSTEEALGSSGEMYRILVEMAQDIIFVISRDDRVLYVNNYAAAKLGLTPDQIIGKPRAGFFPPKIAHLQESSLRKVFQEGKAITTAGILDIFGKTIWLTTRLIPATWKDGRVDSVMGISRDISDLKETEKVVLENEAKYQTLFEASTDAIFLETMEGKILDCNVSACEMFGYPKEQLIELTVFDLVSKEASSHLPTPKEKLSVYGRRPIETQGRRSDGSVFPIEVSIGTIKFGDHIMILAYVRDITERKEAALKQQQLEAQFRQAQKMEALGQMAGGVAHDFNNLLTAILGSTELGLVSLAEDSSHIDREAIRGYLEEIQQAGQRATSLTRQLLVFSRKQVTKTEIVDPNMVISDLENLLVRLLGDRINIKLSLAANIGHIRVNPGHLDQIIMNLVVNARDAMPDGGCVTIATANVEIDSSLSLQRLNVRPGPYVMITVRDTGIGMDETTLNRIFEPFFTTKPMDKGTGLGLATVYSMVNQAGGDIIVESRPGAGTCFRVYFPRAVQATGEPASGCEAALGTGHETILICEDEPLVRRLACRILRNAGYNVLETENAEQAIERANTYPGAIQLLITDVIGPGMNESQLTRTMIQKRPEIGVLCISDDTANLIVPPDSLNKQLHFIAKPFKSEQLLQQVREVIGRQPPR